MTRQLIENLIRGSIKKLQEEKVFPEFSIPPQILIERCPKTVPGDYATNIALIIASQIEKSSMEVAQLLANRLIALSANRFEKIEAVKPGFINFFLSKKYLQQRIAEILEKKDKFGQLKLGRGKKVNIEFISANPTGPLHIGNGRSAFASDVLANILAKAGYKVRREYFVNDAKVNTQIKILGKTALGKGKIYLTSDLKAKIKKLQPKLKRVKNEGEAGYLLARKIQKDIRNFIKKKLNIKFNSWIFEEELYKKNKVQTIFNWLKKKKLVYVKDKAWWIKTSQFGDERDWVVIRETGEPTYLLSDIAYHKYKFDRGFQKVINIWGADHQAHVPKIKAAAKMLGFKGKLDILISQLVTLKGREKISKRKGEIISLEDLIDEIGLDVARFFYLQKSLQSHMEIDLALAKQQTKKNPVFYIQYAFARICSILRKLKTKNKKPKTTSKNLKLLNHPSELNLIKQLIEFPEIIEDIAKDYQIQRMPHYAMELATALHQFYRDCRVISENKNLTQARLALISATKIVLKNTLSEMGISAPEKM